VYSNAPHINYLAEYAERYDCVEVDQWFWSLHGPDREGIEKKTKKDWSRIIEPRDVDLEAVGNMPRDARVRRRTQWVFVNNHFEGCAPLCDPVWNRDSVRLHRPRRPAYQPPSLTSSGEAYARRWQCSFPENPWRLLLGVR
jgi:hypothetical protein